MAGPNWGGKVTSTKPFNATFVQPNAPVVNLPDKLRTRATTHAFLISPAERPPITDLGTVSSIPETMGADIAWMNGESWIGVQRKRVDDLISSAADGRLALEVAQLQQVDLAVLIVEGRPSFTSDGNYVGGYGGGRGWSRKRWDMLLLSVGQAGIIVSHSDSSLGTAELCCDIADHVRSGSDSGLGNRPNRPPSSKWGTIDSISWLAWFYQACPGIGGDTARAIASALGPIWTVTATVEDLLGVEGVGRKRAEDLIRALGGTVPEKSKRRSRKRTEGSDESVADGTVDK